MEKLSLKIEHDLIAEALFELRFDSSYPSEAVFGVVYQIVKKLYPNIENIALPILQLPEAVRNADPNLKYQPHNRLQNGSWGFSIGPKVIVFFVQKPYIGWKEWKPIIIKVLNELIEAKLFKNVERSSLRYLDFVNESIFSVANVSVKIINEELKNQPTTLRTEYIDEDYIKIMHIFNNTNMLVNNVQMQGSLIDIDIIRHLKFINVQNFSQKLEEILDESHNKTKILFFNFLNKEYLEKLRPSYE